MSEIVLRFSKGFAILPKESKHVVQIDNEQAEEVVDEQEASRIKNDLKPFVGDLKQD